MEELSLELEILRSEVSDGGMEAYYLVDNDDVNSRAYSKEFSILHT